ncbi:ABC transporter ATP-binding protein [Georgenia thermotolerans]|uniref:ABC transporter ATP-binding protein n=1 Tax=Georgenia thermotolerans TaxID=527326 RepID=UPI00147949E1|nr:ABC transporter ATP-binding protein [Georgenia thermotolerans]
MELDVKSTPASTSAPSIKKGNSATGVAVEFRHVTRRFGPVQALTDASLKISAGEFIALLGPSGSGKTTLLNILAGFEVPDEGSVWFDGKDVTQVPVHERELGYVFQRYALFPNMTVGQNVEYPLRAKRVSRQTARQRVENALELVDMAGYGNRRIDQLSGGQQQRVALARSLVYRPGLMLMDEPLGALDRKLRERVQLEIRELHREVEATFVYVTHDQDEAMMLADRIAVVDKGRINQVGTPAELYGQPKTRVVAGFLGDMNFLPCSISATTAGEGVHVQVGNHVLPAVLVREDEPHSTGGPVLAIRPESIRVDATTGMVPAIVCETIFLGATVKFVVECMGHKVTAVYPAHSAPLALRPGARVYLTWDRKDATCFDAA